MSSLKVMLEICEIYTKFRIAFTKGFDSLVVNFFFSATLNANWHKYFFPSSFLRALMNIFSNKNISPSLLLPDDVSSQKFKGPYFNKHTL